MGGLCEERSEEGRGGRPQLRGLCEERSKEGRRGRPQLRWEDCVKRDLRKAEEEDHS